MGMQYLGWIQSGENGENLVYLFGIGLNSDQSPNKAQAVAVVEQAQGV